MRKIKTLLLCNIEHEEISEAAEIYKNIYCGEDCGASGGANSNEEQKCGRRYFALGNTDAFSIYDTPRTKSAEDTESSHLADIYEDKKTIKRNISQKLSDQVINYTYHPIYLVEPDESDLKENQSDELDQYAFCVVTLAYGISYGKFDYKKEAEKDDSEKKSRFESRILEFTEGIRSLLIDDKTVKAEKNEKVRLLMYNAVNICDAVIMLYSNNLANALQIARKLTSKVVGEEGKATPVAEKTYTMVGFQITSDFNQSSFDSDNYLVTKNLKTADEYNLRVHGTVKNYRFFNDLETSLFRKELNGDGAAMLGRDDFRFEIKQTGFTLSKYLDLLLTWNKSISRACQEIHTEFVFPNFDPVEQYEENTGGPISEFYDKANVVLHETISKSGGSVSPWILAYRELLSNYQNIKKSPVLRDSAYIIYDFVKTVNAYINEHTKSDGSLDVPGYQEYASITIRNWISLTEQMTRVDDLIFTGFGHTPAITNTLPESILEYYHAVIRKLVDQLLKWDASYYQQELSKLQGDGAVSDNNSIQYDFLMVPALNQRFQIVQMFDTNYEYQIQADETCCKRCNQCEAQKCWRLAHWPLTQVYLIKFSSEDLYRPAEFFPKLVHEVFHTFGDAFRCREERVNRAAMFLADTWTRNINLNTKIDDLAEINGLIFSWLGTELLKLPQRKEPHLRDTMTALQKRLKEIRQDPDSVTQILNKIKEYDKKNKTSLLDNNYWIFNDRFESRWTSGFDKDWDEIIDQEGYLFKECFADVMMIHFLQLPVEDYIELLRFETSQPIGSEKDGELLVLQRFAAVMSVSYSQEPKEDWQRYDEVLVRGYINGIYYQTRKENGEDLSQADKADYLFTLVQNLIKKEERRGFNNSAAEKVTFPQWAFEALCDYLKEAIKQFDNYIIDETEEARKAHVFLDKLKKMINEKSFFTPAYYRLIHEHHEIIRSENKAPVS